MRLLHPFAGLLALANAAGIETKRDTHHFPTASDRPHPIVAQDKPYNTPVNTPPVTPSLISPATFSAGPSSSSASASASASASSSSTASSASSTTNTANDDDDNNNDETNPTCTNPSATGTNLLSNGDFSLADGSSWTIAGNLTFLPGNWPSYGIDSVPSTSSTSSSSSSSSSSPDSPDGEDEDGTANAFYANVRAPERREVTLAQDFEAPPGGGKLYFGVELRASRAKPPASVGCEHYSQDGGEEAAEGLVDGPVPVPAERGSWAQWGRVFDGGAEGTKQGVRCRIVVEEGDFDGNKDVTVFIRNVVVAGCD